MHGYDNAVNRDLSGIERLVDTDVAVSNVLHPGGDHGPKGTPSLEMELSDG